MIQRLIGILTLRAPVYNEVAHDPAATQQAGIIVLISAVLSAIGSYGAVSTLSTQLGTPAPSLIGVVVQQLLTSLLTWGLGGWLLAFVAKTFFKGQTNAGEMMRVSGFTQGFGFLGVLGLIPCVGALIGLVTAVMSIVGNVIGIREAAGFDTTKAILTAIIAGVATFVVAAVVAGVVGGLLGAGGGSPIPLPAG
jgi:hypothetical protein